MILYDLIYDKMYETAPTRELTTQQSRKIVAHSFNIPYAVWACVLKIMEKEGWIERENKRLIKLKYKPKNVISNLGRYYKQLEIYKEDTE